MLDISNAHYWGYRIDTDNAKFFWKELQEGQLRQGWGYDEGQDLRVLSVNRGASRNKRMLNVKKGDILLVPRLPTWGEVAVVQATADWREGYNFQISEEYGDYGHIFPAEFLKRFRRKSSPVSGSISSTLKNPMRFWNIDHLAEDVQKILYASDEELNISRNVMDQMSEIIKDEFRVLFDEQKYAENLIEKLNKKFKNEDWEKILEQVFQKRYPSAQVERVGGRKEELHGTDILIKIPSPSDDKQYAKRNAKQYAIAIQIKDWIGKISINDVIDQIGKASHWKQQQEFQLIDKIVIFTRAGEEANKDVFENKKIESGEINLIFKEHLGVLLVNYAKSVIDLEEDD